MVNFGPLAAEIGLPVWGTPANFNGRATITLGIGPHSSLHIYRTIHTPTAHFVHVMTYFYALISTVVSAVL